MNQQVKYALVNLNTGEPATWVHQDDMETPITADSLGGLLDQIGDWDDIGFSDAQKRLCGSEYTATSGDRFKIVRQETIEIDLLPSDLELLALMT